MIRTATILWLPFTTAPSLASCPEVAQARSKSMFDSPSTVALGTDRALMHWPVSLGQCTVGNMPLDSTDHTMVRLGTYSVV